MNDEKTEVVAYLLANRIITPDGTVLQSFHVHDYKTYTDKNGEEYMVDGGLSYLRRNINKVPATDASVYSCASHEDIREAFCWGTYGKDGKQTLKYKPLKTLEDEHISAILETQKHISGHIRKVFLDEVEFRNNL